ncbi:hypothetical protein [Mycobacterium sp. MMS18-G62]
MKRGILIACTFATVLGSLSVAAPAAADGCPYGTLPTRFPGVCSAGQGGAPPAPIVVAPTGSVPTTAPGSAFTSVDGIPCNQQHISTCIGLSQQP